MNRTNISYLCFGLLLPLGCGPTEQSVGWGEGTREQGEVAGWGTRNRERADDGKVKVFVLAGQSNMHGHGEISAQLNPNVHQKLGTLHYAVTDDPDHNYYRFLVGASGGWIERNDVYIRAHDRNDVERSGGLTIGYGADYQKSIGPELGFGHYLGDQFPSKVLLIKAAWGGKSLGGDFRPPSASGDTGAYFKKLLNIVRTVTANIGRYVPGYRGEGYEIAGFAWHQGWNDRSDPALSAEYERNMAFFIRDLRGELGVAGLPFVIATTSMDPTPDYTQVELAQLAMADPSKYPEFVGNVAVVDARGSIDGRPFWYPPAQSPDTSGNQGFHWNRNGKTHIHLGRAMAKAVVKLIQTKTGTSGGGGDDGIPCTDKEGVPCGKYTKGNLCTTNSDIGRICCASCKKKEGGRK